MSEGGQRSAGFKKLISSQLDKNRTPICSRKRAKRQQKDSRPLEVSCAFWTTGPTFTVKERKSLLPFFGAWFG